MLQSEVVPREAFSEVGQTIMHWVYILESEKDGSHYIGVTADIKRRVAEHNSGNSKYSSTKMPYRLKWCCCFLDKGKAYEFERYLKSSSGHAFTRKHLI